MSSPVRSSVYFSDAPTLWWPDRQYVFGEDNQSDTTNRNLQLGSSESRQGEITHIKYVTNNILKMTN